eukprot:365157-Chlamydomonas_euryale.AAC.32
MRLVSSKSDNGVECSRRSMMGSYTSMSARGTTRLEALRARRLAHAAAAAAPAACATSSSTYAAAAAVLVTQLHLPQKQLPVLANGCKPVHGRNAGARRELRVRVKRDARYPRVVALEVCDHAALLHAIHHDQIILTARGDILAVGAECAAQKRAVVRVAPVERRTAAGVQQAQRAIAARHSQQPPVWGCRQVVDAAATRAPHGSRHDRLAAATQPQKLAARLPRDRRALVHVQQA